MKRSQFALVEGHRQHPTTVRWDGRVKRAVSRAILAGYRIGQQVLIGRVSGQVIGYNIGAFGGFSGARFPLLVSTDLGVVKCNEDELTPA